MFDTGKDRLALDSTFLANVYFENLRFTQGRIGGVGTGGMRTVPFIADTLSLKFENHIYETASIPVLNRKSGAGDFYDGVLGHRYFSNNKYLMEINYDCEYLMLHNEANEMKLSNYTKIDIEIQKFGNTIRFYVPLIIQVNDTFRIQETLLLDIGSGGSLFLATPIAEKYNLAARTPNKVRAVVDNAGISGQSTTAYFQTNFVEIGGYKLDNMELRYSEDRSGFMISEQASGGLLGNRLLDNFDVIIDFGDTPALYLKPNRNFNIPFEDLSLRRGFGYADRSQTLKGWVVRAFFEDSPAAKSGLQSGDKIIFVNGVCIQEIPYEKQRDFWKSLDKVELIVLRNDEKMKFEFEINSNRSVLMR